MLASAVPAAAWARDRPATGASSDHAGAPQSGAATSAKEEGSDSGKGNANANGAANGSGNGNSNGNGNGDGNGDGNGNGGGNGNGKGVSQPAADVGPPDEVPTVDVLVTALSLSTAVTLDQEDATAAVLSGRAMPLGQIVALAEQRDPAKVIDAELVLFRSMLIYKLTTLSQQGISQQLFFSALTGAFLGKR
jgi:hypothetical protein